MEKKFYCQCGETSTIVRKKAPDTHLGSFAPRWIWVFKTGKPCCNKPKARE